MPKLKPMTLEQYLDSVADFDHKKELGMNADNVVGFLYAHANLNSNRFYDTMKAEEGFTYEGMYKNMLQRINKWVMGRF